MRDTPAREERSRQGRRNRENGAAAERRVARYFGGQRVPLSGAAGGRFSGDVQAHGLRIEVKRVRGAMALARRWLAQGNADLLVVLQPGQAVRDGLVIMRPELARELLLAMEGAQNDG